MTAHLLVLGANEDDALHYVLHSRTLARKRRLEAAAFELKCTVSELHSKPKNWVVMEITNPKWSIEDTKRLFKEGSSSILSWWSKRYRTFDEAVAYVKTAYRQDSKFHIIKLEK